MATHPRLCVNCKHYKEGLTYGCLRDTKVTYKKSPVTGKVKKSTTAGENAHDERTWVGPRYCGPDAKFYVEKRLTRRLIAKFKL